MTKSLSIKIVFFLFRVCFLCEQNKSYLIKYVDHSQFPLKYIYDFFKTYLKIGITKWIYVEK
jgi:hypothetical protein